MELNTQSVLVALGFTLIAGMATGVGSLLALFYQKINDKFLAWSLGLSAGVMVYVSFMEIIPEAFEYMSSCIHGKLGEIIVIAGFFTGIALIALIDWLIPEDENPHETITVDQATSRMPENNLKRTGIMVALAIAIHNFPEGIATFVAGLDGIDVALPIVIAVAIHNIPEGIAVSVPIYHATGNRNKALKMSLLSGFAEPLGAVVALIFLLPFWTPIVNSVVLSIVAGIMVYISFDELLPGAEKFGHHHYGIIGVISGMFIMALSLFML